MKVIQTIKDERGFALIMALVVMAAMTAIGIAAVTSSTTDLMIARNERESKVAFYLAEAGLEEGVARLSLEDDHARYKGETYTMAGSERETRKENQAAAVLGKSFTSATLGADLDGTYSVEVEYTRESTSGNAWCEGGDCSDNELVVYCYGFIGGNAPGDCDSAFPVYEITSTGTTVGGTVAVVRAYVSPVGLNLLPPGDTILFTEGEIAIGGGGSIGGNVASFSEFMGDVDVDGCDGVDCVNLSIDVDDGPGVWEPPYVYDASATDNEGVMLSYLGMSLDAVRSYADVSDLHTGNNAFNISSSDYADDGGFGTMCDTDSSGAGDPDFDNHICNNKPQIIVIDNYDDTNHESYGSAKITGGTGRGLLIITGDLELAGNFTWEGMIFVMGDLKVTGTAVVYGTLMIEGDGIVENVANQADVYVNGSLDVFGSRPVASGVAIGMSVPRMLRWTRL